VGAFLFQLFSAYGSRNPYIDLTGFGGEIIVGNTITTRNRSYFIEAASIVQPDFQGAYL
jgi:hypothetical protein